MYKRTRRATGICTRRTTTHRGRRRGLVALALAVSVVGLLLTAATPASAAIPSNFFTVVDTGGANDINSGQVDLTQFGRDDTNASVFKLFWSWDATNDWTGTGQTGDACALFDTNGDGNINEAVCVEINNPGADPTVVAQTAGSPFVFTCNDSKNDRCAGPSAALAYTSSDIQAGTLTGGTPGSGNLITPTDPFPWSNADQDWANPNGPGGTPNDSTIQINILKSYLQAGAVLVNVCSFPSAANGGNNNPFDCIVNPGGGFLKIVKNASGSNASSTTFNFTVNPGSISKSITGSGDTGAFTMPLGSSYSVAETVPSGWSLTGASCVKEGGGSTGSLSGSTVSSITVESGKVTTCTFNDLQDNPHLAITKSASPTSFSAKDQVITYTIVATNDGNVTLHNVSVTDTPALDGFSCSPTIPVADLAPGASITCTGTHTITQADLDAGKFDDTACVDDGAGGAAQACKDLSTPGTKNPHLAITKTATESGFSNVGDVIHYTIVATNDGNVTLSNVTVTDSQVSNLTCTPSNPVASLAPGGTINCTASHTIVQADLDAGSFYNQACVDDGTGGAAQACSSVTTPSVAKTGQITPTATTCSNFANGTAGNLDTIFYGVKGGKIGNVSPGVLFYYSKVTVGAGTHTISVSQTTSPSFTLFGIQQSQAILYTSGCTMLQSNASGSFNVTVSSTTTFIIGIKYDPSTVVGKTKPSGNGQVVYTFTTVVDGSPIASSSDSLTLKQKPK